MARQRPVGTITRGTTNPNRLRRVDRWISGPQAWRLRRHPRPPVVVDLGYGASPTTAVELHARVRKVRPDAHVVGIEIDPQRVDAAKPLEREGLAFRRGGFEVPLDEGARPAVVRAFNVLRQYPESDVGTAWGHVLDRLAPDGVFVDGTCDEIGRKSTWVAVESGGPVSLTISQRLGGLAKPSDVAERLPKVLIHRNVAGEPIHAYLRDLDKAWTHAAPQAAWGARQRFLETARTVSRDWPLLDGPSRWRLGEITVAWDAVAPS